MGAHLAVRLGLVAGLVIAATLAGPTVTASASCATERPLESRYAFVGTVIDTRSQDRIATVVTDAGDRVVVRGTDAARFSTSIGSTDRRYAIGARYEFHPLNPTDPFRDNACTATRKLAGPDLPPQQPRDDALPGWLPVDEQAGPIGYLMIGVPVIAGVLGLTLLLRWGSRRGRRRTQG